MKYKNIIFDFGNVIGRFNGNYLLNQFCTSEEDCRILGSIIFRQWKELDGGMIDYDTYTEESVSMAPEHLTGTVRDFFRVWPEHITLLDDTIEFIDSLAVRNIPFYLLSNASTYFADYALEHFSILKKFSGVVFSAPLKMAKPDPEIYRYLFQTYDLNPSECFFIDDLAENIEAGRALGMDGIIFDGRIDAVKTALLMNEKK